MIRLIGVGLGHPARARAGAAPALDAISLDIPDGGFRWLTGGAGAGKSALLDVLALRRNPGAGRLEMFGTDITRARRAALAKLRRRIGHVREEPRLIGALTAFENVALPLRIAGMRAGAARIDAIEMLEWVGLGARMDARAAALSRSERQLCALARAAVGRPDLLLADEPLAPLDDEEGLRLFALIVEMNRIGTIVIVATRRETVRALHDAPEIRLEAGRLAGWTASIAPAALRLPIRAMTVA